MSQSAVSRFEKGEGDIGLMTLCRYATSLGLQPAITFVPAASSYQNAEKLRDVAHAIEQLYAAAPTALNRPDTEQGVEVVTRRRKKGAKQEGMPVDFADWASAANATMLRNVSAEFAQILSNMPAFRSDKDSES
jgi:transcriptional regulator with XRE-family HTH domain